MVMIDVYGTKVQITALRDDDEAKFTSHPMYHVEFDGQFIGYVVNNPVGWFEVYPDGMDAPYRETRRECLNKLIAMAEWNSRIVKD